MDHGLAPDEGDAAGVVAVDEGIDMVPELLNIGEAVAGQRAALENGEPDLDLVEPGTTAAPSSGRNRPVVTMADPSAGVLAEILQLPSEIDLRRLRLALLLVLPLGRCTSTTADEQRLAISR
jgi:hypothetical protein